MVNIRPDAFCGRCYGWDHIEANFSAATRCALCEGKHQTTSHWCLRRGNGRGGRTRTIVHTFNNHTHRAEVLRLERGSGHGEPSPLTLASQCGSVSAPPPRRVHSDAGGPMARPAEKHSQEGGGEEVGVGLTLRKITPRPATRRKMFGQTTANYNIPH